MSDDREKLILYGIIGIIVIAIMAYSGTLQSNVENIQNAVTQLCGIDEKVGQIINTLKTINPEVFDQRALQIYNQLLSGNSVSKCDLWYFYQQLDDENRKKLKWNEFICNVNDCLK